MVQDRTELREELYTEQRAFAEELSRVVKQTLGESYDAHPGAREDVEIVGDTMWVHALVTGEKYAGLLEGLVKAEDEFSAMEEEYVSLNGPSMYDRLSLSHKKGICSSFEHLVEKELQDAAIEVERLGETTYQLTRADIHSESELVNMGMATYTFRCTPETKEDAMKLAEAWEAANPDSVVILDYKRK